MFGYKKLHIVVLARIWNLASGLLLVLVASNVFSALEQGAFYTFLSLGAAQYFFDLGVGFVLANLAGINTPEDEDGVHYNEKELSYIRASVRFAIKWSAVAGLVLIVVLGLVGLFVLSGKHEAELGNIRLAWLCYVVMVAIAMGFQLMLRLYEGLGFVVEAAISRSIQSFGNIVILYLLAIAGFGMIAMAIALGLAVAAASLWFIRSSDKIRSSFTFGPVNTKAIDWKRDIWPFQSRMALSWVASYVIFQMQTPALYALSNPLDAGRFGIMVQIFQALNTSANIFLTYHVRDWTRFSSKGEIHKLNKSFIKTLWLTTGLMAFGSAAVLFGLWMIGKLGWSMADRFPDMGLMVLYAIAATWNQVFFSLGYYFRARGKEPLWSVSLAAALVILIVPLILWHNYNIEAASWSFFAASILVLGMIAPLYSYYLAKKVL